jgi:hypothetical protein
MSFVQDIMNGITGNLATDLLKGMGRQISNTELVRKIEQRVNPEQLPNFFAVLFIVLLLLWRCA